LATLQHRPRRARRSRAALAVTVAALVALSGCAQGTTHPRLQSIAVTGAEPAVTVAPSPSPSPTPTVEPTPDAGAPLADGTAPCPAGEFQAEVENALDKIGSYGRVVADGKQSVLDCDTIVRFQTRMGIVPNDGTPGPTTNDVATRIAATDVTQCPISDSPVACVDLANQTFYIAQNAVVLLGPTVTRTGMPGWATPAGDYPIGGKARTTWSVPFSVWLPYWQQFYFGDGLHETTTYIHNMAVGSHGCVNLLHDDAVRAYELLGVGSVVQVYGRRPGT
jgi:lipoprotein-anchoring transpeptidase ErfK/SrfK